MMSEAAQEKLESGLEAGREFFGRVRIAKVAPVPWDAYVEALFEGRPSFGRPIDESIGGKHGILIKCLKAQAQGFWSGHTIYHIMVDGGLLVDAKPGKKRLTHLGELYLEAMAGGDE